MSFPDRSEYPVVMGGLISDTKLISSDSYVLNHFTAMGLPLN